jgi:RHS repeat-associated protein
MVILQTVLPVFPQILTAVAAAPMPVNSSPTSPVQTPSEPVVIVNRTVPVVTSAPKNLPFSENPTDAEISQSHTFGQPLIPIGATTLEENKALAVALTHFRNRTNNDDVTALADFLSSHATSAWNAALLLNLGTVYRHTGWFSKALDAWEQSWALAKDETDPQAKDVADTAVSELIELNARLGRYERLGVLFSEIAGRRFDPAVNQNIQGAREGLWLMQNRPQDAFRCGPMALAQIGAPKGMSAGEFGEKIHQSRSTSRGMSLTSVCELANDLGMNYQMAWRSPGSAIVLPAVIHWKAGHYAALIRQSGENYLIKDPTFGEDIWISRAALDGEGSGYCLVTSGKLPAGWRTVGTAEGQTIFGKGNTHQKDLSHTKPTDPRTCQPPCCPMAQYSVQLMLVSLNIMDTPVGYTPPRGPDMHFQVTYNQKEAYPNGATPPLNFGYSNLGSQWTFNWMAYIIDDPINTANDAYYFVQGGGYEDYTGFNTTSQSYAVQPDSQAVLIRTSSTSYERDLPDGSKQIFSQADGSASYPRRIFLTQIKDPVGNTQTLTYNSVAGGFQLVAATDAIGQVTLITNELSSDPFKITKVTDPFGRAARFKYNGSGQLTNITDIIGINSSFTYDWQGTVVSLTTPYGTSTFAYAQVDTVDAWIEATDPLGQKERVEFTQGAGSFSEPLTFVPSGPGVSTFNQYLNFRNTFYWDKRAMQLYPGDYTKAKIYHWLHTGDLNVCSGIIESTKNPLEDRVWYNYSGQANAYQLGTNNFPSAISRVLDDGTSQIYQYQYNLIGKPTLVIDPTNRTTGFVYDANNVDLLQVYQMVGTTSSNVLGQFTYNSQHLPLTTVDAAGKTSFFGYNTNGQLLALTNALNEIVLLKYNTNGYLTNIVTGTTTSLLSTNKFTYDGYGRVRTVTDPLGYTVTASYDAADRPTNITYLDGTYQQVVYNFLDPVLARDRNGHWTSMAYDPLRHLTDMYDNLGRHTQFGWCGCGSLESITDPLNNVTAWVRDLQGRVQTKIYPDLTQINYAYETNSSRLHSVTDAKSQSTLYSYFIDDNLQQITYSNAVVATPSVSFTYDTNYNRVTTMTDGTGVTTYRYYNVTNGQLGAGQLSSVSNSFIGASSVIAYNYDAVGRITNRAINGVSQQVAFDALHRVMLVTNVLGRFTNTYVGGTMLLSTNFAPNGKKTIFSYLSITNDERLAEILNQKTNSVTLSKFDYAYDPVGQITNWTQQADAATPTAYTYQYDAGNQILNAVLKSTGVGAMVLKQYAYGYDLAGNRTSEQIDTGMSQSSYNYANQLTSKTSGSGPMQFAGTVNKQATVTVGGNAATVNHTTTNFTGYASVSSGTNVITVSALDYNGNSTNKNYQVVVTNNGVAKAITYDLNGNETNVVTATSTNSYQFDAANRLVTITGPTNQSLFTYDGFGRRVQIIEKTNGVAYVTNKFVWDGMGLCEQRDSTGGSVTKRFFGGGEQISGTNYYFTRDHLGNIREMVDSAGVIQVRYDYDPYGRQTKISGSLDADFGYAGMYRHPVSGLNLTLFRAYDSDSGRWLNHDPIQEWGGLNLYGYVGNNPVNYVDPLGLWGIQFGSVNIGWGNPNLAFDNSSWYDVANGAAATADGLLPQPIFQDLYQNGDPFDDSSDSYPADYQNALNNANSVGWAIASPLKGDKPTDAKINCPPNSGNQPMVGMMGDKGTQLTSKTVWKGQNSRLDVENPAPGERPGQLHYQDATGNKYLYDPAADSFPGAPKSVNNLLNNPNFRNGIQKGLRYLGEVE